MKQQVNNKDKTIKIKIQPSEHISTIGKMYKKPRLELLGDLRSLTLSGSPGVLDSNPSQGGNPGEI